MRQGRAPALAASAALHGLVLGAGLLALPYAAKPVELLTATPVTIVTQAPPAAVAAPVAAPIPEPEIVPAPAPVVAPPSTPKPAPAPPAAAKPTPTPAPVPKPTQKPAPALKADPKPLDLAALTASLPQTKATPSKAKPVDLAALAATLPKSARGTARPAVAPVVGAAPIKPMNGDAYGAVTSKLMRLWSPNCGAEGVDRLVIRVAIHLLPDGRLARPPELLDKPVVEAGGPGAQVAAQRALTAVVRGEPYSEFPPEHYAEWKDFNARFPGKEGCAGH